MIKRQRSKTSLSGTAELTHDHANPFADTTPAPTTQTTPKGESLAPASILSDPKATNSKPIGWGR